MRTNINSKLLIKYSKRNISYFRQWEDLSASARKWVRGYVAVMYKDMTQIMDATSTEITCEDIDKFYKGLVNGNYDMKPRPCLECGKDHFPSYGYVVGECDECWFNRFPKEQVEEFFRSFF